MKSRNLIRETIALCLVLAGILSPATSLAELAKDFSLAGVENSTVNLQDYRGKIVYLDFWASWCLPCLQSFPWMDDIQAKYQEQGFEVLAVNLDSSKDDAEEFLLDNPINFLVAFDPDGRTPEAYGVIGMPSSFLIDRNGEIVSSHIGFNSSFKEEFEETLKQLLEQQP